MSLQSNAGDNNADADPRQFDLEKIARVLSLVAIPIVLAIVGWLIQDRLAVQNVRQEYVKLAVSILENPSSAQSPAELRDWAVDLLTQNAPTKFSSETIQQLKAGKITLSGAIGNLLATSNNGGGLAVSPDAKTVATGQEDGHVRIWDLRTGHLIIELAGQRGQITAVAFTPDARNLVSGSLDKTIVAWDVGTGRMLNRIQTNSPIVGLAMSPDGTRLVSRTEDGHFQVWEYPTTRLLSETKIQTQ